MLFLTNAHVKAVLDMPTCLDALEDAYRELAEQRAAYRPRIDLNVPGEPHYYRWTSAAAGVVLAGYQRLRSNHQDTKNTKTRNFFLGAFVSLW